MNKRELKQAIDFQRKNIRALLHLREALNGSARVDLMIASARGTLQGLRQAAGELEEDCGSDPSLTVKPTAYRATDRAAIVSCNARADYYGCRCYRPLGHPGTHYCCHGLAWLGNQEDAHVAL